RQPQQSALTFGQKVVNGLGLIVERSRLLPAPADVLKTCQRTEIAVPDAVPDNLENNLLSGASIHVGFETTNAIRHHLQQSGGSRGLTSSERPCVLAGETGDIQERRGHDSDDPLRVRAGRVRVSTL